MCHITTTLPWAQSALYMELHMRPTGMWDDTLRRPAACTDTSVMQAVYAKQLYHHNEGKRVYRCVGSSLNSGVVAVGGDHCEAGTGITGAHLHHKAIIINMSEGPTHALQDYPSPRMTHFFLKRRIAERPHAQLSVNNTAWTSKEPMSTVDG